MVYQRECTDDIEFTVTGYTAKNNHGSSIKLLSVGLLDDETVGYNFESPKKNVGCNSIVNLVQVKWK